MQLSAIPVLCMTFALAATAASAQAPVKGQYRARLSPVPIDVTMQNAIAGTGSVTAVVAGNKVSITGTFSGLKSGATGAKIHSAPKGLRGPAVLDLVVTAGTSGTISGSIELTAAQLDELANSGLYVQLNSEKAPDGNLWGWLLPQETRR
jgi:hypothetical protein